MDKILPQGVVIVDLNEAPGLIPKRCVTCGALHDPRTPVCNLHLPPGELKPTFDKFTVAELGRAKRGDFVRLLLRFTERMPDGTDNPRAIEFLTGVVTSRTPGGMLKVKVYSRPEKTWLHSVDNGDDLTLSDRYVLAHEISSEQTAREVEPFISGVIPIAKPVNAEDAKLRAASEKLPPLVPQAGRQYWTRNGTLVTVWTYRTNRVVCCANCGRQNLGANIQNEMCARTRGYHQWTEIDQSLWLGGTGDGAAIEWKPDGSNAAGLKELDIVRDPRAIEVAG